MSDTDGRAPISVHAPADSDYDLSQTDGRQESTEFGPANPKDVLMHTLDMLLELEDMLVEVEQLEVAERISSAAISTKAGLKRLRAK